MRLILVAALAAAAVDAQDAPRARTFDLFSVRLDSAGLGLPKARVTGARRATVDRESVDVDFDDGRRCILTADPDGGVKILWTHRFGAEGTSMRDGPGRDAMYLKLAERYRSRGRSPRLEERFGIVREAVDGDPAPETVDADALMREALEASTGAGGGAQGAGEFLGSFPLRKLLSEAEAASYAEAWREKRSKRAARRNGFEPTAPLLALADAETVRRLFDEYVALADSLSRRPEDGAEPVDFTPTMHPVVYERPLTLAYLQTDDPVVKGYAGWMLYERNRGYMLEALTDDVTAGRVVLPGDDAQRAQREQRLVRARRTRDVRSGAVAFGAGAATLVALLFAMRFGLRRLLFR
ncbi:MAG TPA: hypothetical protein VEI02_08495 [Planctomycetota bacterium]|nr:hypothetical protein [Planctomycetota bacterium]